ncbi:YkvA family protein [Persicobacter sp. CCB-QB2]|uniref:YkvA family protein n=1 Tax=Persicobacter sp. CCB-QB2 TaxID=1561025 RepID=UPI0006A95FC1|nr:YkvA family protein [Persicobacter sp. CCB-QB2]
MSKRQRILNRAINSGFFRYALQRGASLLADYKSIDQLYGDVHFHLTNRNGQLRKATEEIKLFAEMVVAYAKGKYTGIPWSSITMITAGLVYFISPIDAIPDFIPVAGLVDDVSVILWIYNSLKHEIDKFKDWKLHEEQTILDREEPDKNHIE